MKRPDAGEGAAGKRPLPDGAGSGGAKEEKRFFGGGAVDGAESCSLLPTGCANSPLGVEEEEEEEEEAEGPFVNIPPKDEEDGGAVPNIDDPGPGVTLLASSPSLDSDNEPCW